MVVTSRIMTEAALWLPGPAEIMNFKIKIAAAEMEYNLFDSSSSYPAICVVAPIIQTTKSVIILTKDRASANYK